MSIAVTFKAVTGHFVGGLGFDSWPASAVAPEVDDVVDIRQIGNPDIPLGLVVRRQIYAGGRAVMCFVREA